MRPLLCARIPSAHVEDEIKRLNVGNPFEHWHFAKWRATCISRVLLKKISDDHFDHTFVTRFVAKHAVVDAQLVLRVKWLQHIVDGFICLLCAEWPERHEREFVTLRRAVMHERIRHRL